MYVPDIRCPERIIYWLSIIVIITDIDNINHLSRFVNTFINFFSQTILAAAIEQHIVAVNDTRGAALGILVQFLKGPKIHVVNLAAFSTHKMIMLSGVPIKISLRFQPTGSGYDRLFPG